MRDLQSSQQPWPSVSVVIPCYNGEKWIVRCIESVLNQRNLYSEVIVVDDGSTDRSLDVISSFGHTIRWKTGANQGACAARNLGLHLAKGEYTMFLDADDYVEPDSLAEWAACGANADIVFGPFAYETSGRRTAGRTWDYGVSPEYILRGWLRGWFTPPCAVLWRRSFLCTINGWNAGVLRNQDGELTIRALLHGARVAIAGRGLGVYVQHEHPGRVSRREGRKTFASELLAFDQLWAVAVARGKTPLQSDFAQAFYHIAYRGFAAGVDDVGRVALSRARQLGLRGHPGTLGHRTLSGILGLRNKLRVTGLVKGRRMVVSSGEA